MIWRISVKWESVCRDGIFAVRLEDDAGLRIDLWTTALYAWVTRLAFQA